MRRIINISLPPKLNKIVDENLKSGEYASKSEFFRHLLRIWTEGRLLKELDESRKEIAANRGMVLKSLKNLR